jgi:hypothetical protein
VLSDDLAQGDVGCYGQKLIKTPHLDAMAKDGTRFTQPYCGTSVCAPSRTSLMLGKHMGVVAWQVRPSDTAVQLQAVDQDQNRHCRERGNRQKNEDGEEATILGRPRNLSWPNSQRERDEREHGRIASDHCRQVDVLPQDVPNCCTQCRPQ